MALSRCAPRVEIAPPAAIPRPFGLFSIADLREVDDGTWSHGIQYRTESCSGNVYTWPKPCPPACEPDCDVAVTITVHLEHTAKTRTCGDISTIAATVQDPASVAMLPFRTVITAGTDCGPSVDLVPAGGRTEALRHTWAGPAKPITVTISESLNGTAKTIKLAPGATADVTLTVDPKGPRKKTLDGRGPWIGSDPFPVYSSVHCTPGAGFADEAKRIAIDRMQCNEECAVEEYLWGQLAKDGGKYVGDPAKPKPFMCAMAELEAQMAQARACSVGVLHVPAQLSMPLSTGGCCFIEEERGSLHTRLGTQIALGACYDPKLRPDGQLAGDGQVVIIGTGPVVVQRGPISTYEGLDKVTNDYAAIAERTYAVIADCPLMWTVATTCNC